MCKSSSGILRRMDRRTGFLARRLARRVRELRGELSQVDFAEKIGVSGATISRLEDASQNVSIATLEKLCRSLRCDVADLFSGGEGP